MSEFDTSFYSNLKTPQVQTPDPMAALSSAMSLKDMALKSQVLQKNIASDQAMRDAMKNNVGPDGTPNYQGAVRDLATGGYGDKALELQGQLAQMNKAGLEFQQAQMNARVQRASLFGNALSSLAGKTVDQRAAAWPDMRQNLINQGVISENDAPPAYDDNFYQQRLGAYNSTKEAIENHLKQSESAKNYAEAAKTRSETPQQLNGPVDASTDPAQLVRQVVPKDERDKVFKEIKLAEDIKKQRQTIMDAFDQAAQDQSGIGGRVSSMVRTPRSVNALQGNLMVTLQDVEGSVREAAANSLKDNYTPKGTDTPADVQTRRKALENYLDSKMSAPVARGYGIDLSKFNRTSSEQANGGTGSGPGSAVEVAKSMLKKPSGNAQDEVNTSAAHPQDGVAVAWAKANPKDPRSKRILALNGVN